MDPTKFEWIKKPEMTYEQSCLISLEIFDNESSKKFKIIFDYSRWILRYDFIIIYKIYCEDCLWVFIILFFDAALWTLPITMHNRAYKSLLNEAIFKSWIDSFQRPRHLPLPIPRTISQQPPFDRCTPSLYFHSIYPVSPGPWRLEGINKISRRIDLTPFEKSPLSVFSRQPD